MKKIFYILLITQLTVGLSYSQSGWVKQNFNTALELDGLYFTNENTGYMGASSLDSSRVFKTTNAGVNWIPVFSNGRGGFISVFFLNSNTGFATKSGIIKTTNSGESWNTTYIGSSVLFSIVFTSSDTGYACGKYHTVIKTTNGGENWSDQTNFNTHHQDMCFVNNNTGFIVSEDSYVLKTTNGGDNWLMKSINDTAYLYGVGFINVNTGFCGGWHYSDMYIAKTTNGGENWTESVHGPQGRIYRIRFVNNQTGYAAGTCFLKTTNMGQTWQIQQNLIWIELYSIHFINELTGYACGYDYLNQKGVLYKTTTGGEPIGIQPINEEIPNNFVLQQDYPNPFNPSTKIKFSIPAISPPFAKGGWMKSGGLVTLKIYDILGREVAVLINEQLSPGTYEVEWNGSNFASGIYFYRLNIDGFSETKKMVLLK